MTSHEIPSFSRLLAASNESFTEPAIPTIVQSLPSFTISAFPKGISTSETYPLVPDKFTSSNIITGSSSLIAVFNNPFASDEFAGTTILIPGIFINIG